MPAEIATIKQRVAAGLQPEKDAYQHLLSSYVSPAMSGSPNVYAGPYTGSSLDEERAVFGQLWTDGARARDLALAYVMSADQKYAQKARTYLLAWAQGNTPTRWADAELADLGQLQSYGSFSFAYAYDLTFNSGVYSDADRGLITAYFRRMADALQTCNQLRHPAHSRQDSPRPRRRLRAGAASSAAGTTASSAATSPCWSRPPASRFAQASDNTSLADKILNDQSLPVQSERDALGPDADQPGRRRARPSGPRARRLHLLQPRGRPRQRHGLHDLQREGAPRHGRGAQNMGWAPSNVAAAREKLYNTWSYLARFFGPNAEPLANPNDRINLDACLPRFQLAVHDFGGTVFLNVVRSGSQAGYYEPQLLGPTALTHSITP